jgi:hypothetical protein
MTVTPGRGLTWAALSFTLFMLALLAIFPISAVIRLFGEVPHPAMMVLWSVSWGVLSVLGVLVAAQLAFGAWLRPPPLGIGIAAAGIGLSAMLSIVLQQWATARYGYWDPDLIGWTAGLFALLIGLSTAAFGAFLVPRRLIGWPLTAALLGVAAISFVVASNVPGLSNGIRPDSWPLAVVIGLCGLYALATAGLVLRRALDRSQDGLGI